VDDHRLTDPLRADGGRIWSASTTSDALDIGCAWLTSPALSRLLHALGGPVVRDCRQDLLALVEWSADVLDTRRGSERQAAAPVALRDSHIAALVDAAGPLGMLNTPPPSLPRYDITIVLGGTTTGNDLRARFAAALAVDGIGVGQVVGLAAERALMNDEREATGYRTESEHLDSVLGAVFGQDVASPLHAADGKLERQSETVELERWGHRLLTAPSSRPERRTDTTDAIRYLADHVPPSERRSALVVTSAIYVSYQFLVAAPLLLAEGSRHIEVVGTPTATDGPSGILAQRVAQEIHATIVTLARLLGLI
jgi:hypothetical protein